MESVSEQAYVCHSQLADAKPVKNSLRARSRTNPELGVLRRSGTAQGLETV
jgi:hypothetical protein